MIHLDVDQGSTEWLQARLGIPTSSQFHKIVTPTGKLSKQARGYAFYLVAETLLNQSLESLSNLEWIARGKELEPQAIRMFEFEQDVKTLPVGFITTDDGRLGCTPDRLIEGGGVLELKCPAPQTHVEYMIDGFGNDYVPQVQGQLYVGEFEYAIRYSFHPSMPPVLLKTYRNEGYIACLSAALREFADMKDAMLEQVRAHGYFADRQKLKTAVDEMAKGERDSDLAGRIMENGMN